MSGEPIKRIKLIYNPSSGRAMASPTFLQDLIAALQARNFIPEVCVINPGLEIVPILNEAFTRRIRLFVVCGGDGTIEIVPRWMIGKPAVLGIIPAGTQNNVALSLGIPVELKAAVDVLRTGQRRKIDVGIARCANIELPFLEVCSIGLFSALFNSADQLQKGNLASLGDIFSTLTSFPSAQIQLTLDQNPALSLNGNVVLVANLNYFGSNYRLTSDDSAFDGLLEVLVFADFSNLELVGNFLQNRNDERIRRYRARAIEIQTGPVMPVQVDGIPLGSSPVHISIKKQALSIMTGLPSTGHNRLGFLHNLNLFRFFTK